ncbi:MAG TPA: diguanylate cyclase [Burkholderiaceae bacterium]|nr:diguanylate cyclase [Burkholderiaceae bacterium]
MPRLSTEQMATDWQRLLCRFPGPVLQRMRILAEMHREVLADHFYQQMLQDPAASKLLSHDQVKDRLHGSMQRWVASAFAAAPEDDLQPVVARQMQIGEIHARIDVPVYLVLRGTRSLKRKFHELLDADLELGDAQRVDAIRLMVDVIDLAMEIMSQAYSNSHDRNSRAAEAYRLFSVVQDVATERERQRAALLDWENHLMFELAVGHGASRLPRIGSGEFGLWFRHKGAHAFQGASETALILQALDHIDEVLLPVFDLPTRPGEDERVQRLRELREQARSIAFHLDALFQQNNELEAGRDVLTRLLNRKFLPVVLRKEVNYARQRGASFAVIAIDIDHFKQVNDIYGHEAGDMVLQQVAVLLSNSSRGGDYIFRLGGEEFLLLLVDVDQDRAFKAAEKLRQQVAAERFRLPQERTLTVTISIGLALHNGHPDYKRMLRRADDALYQAKHSGRNCIVVAGD